MLSFFPRGVLDEILNLIESVSEDFPSYSKYFANHDNLIASLSQNLISPVKQRIRLFESELKL